MLRHLDDLRFRGVYIMLASAPPLDEAKALKDAIVDRSADTKDHHLSDAVVQVLRTRRAVQPLPVSSTSGRDPGEHGCEPEQPASAAQTDTDAILAGHPGASGLDPF